MVVGGTLLIVLSGENLCDEIGKHMMESRNHEAQLEHRHEDTDEYEL